MLGLVSNTTEKANMLSRHCLLSFALGSGLLQTGFHAVGSLLAVHAGMIGLVNASRKQSVRTLLAAAV